MVYAHVEQRIIRVSIILTPPSSRLLDGIYNQKKCLYNYQIIIVIEFVSENKTHKIAWDFEIKTNHPIPARRPKPNVN